MEVHTMKKRTIIKLCCFGLVFTLLLGITSQFLQVNSLADGIRVKGFYMEPENSLDMVTIGASETYTSVSYTHLTLPTSLRV